MITITVASLAASSAARECEVQPHRRKPSGCKERAAYRLVILGVFPDGSGGESFLCDACMWMVSAELRRGAPLSVKPDPGPGRN